MLLDVPLGREGVWMWRFRWAAKRGLGERIRCIANGAAFNLPPLRRKGRDDVVVPNGMDTRQIISLARAVRLRGNFGFEAFGVLRAFPSAPSLAWSGRASDF